MISGLVLKYLNGECFVIRRGYETARPASSSFCLTVPFKALRAKVALGQLIVLGQFVSGTRSRNMPTFQHI